MRVLCIKVGWNSSDSGKKAGRQATVSILFRVSQISKKAADIHTWLHQESTWRRGQHRAHSGRSHHIVCHQTEKGAPSRASDPVGSSRPHTVSRPGNDRHRSSQHHLPLQHDISILQQYDHSIWNWLRTRRPQKGVYLNKS